jgi:hypothetical protein
MAAGFFYINMFAGLASQYGCRCVPVVGRGNHQGIKVFLFQQLAYIGYPGWRFTGYFINIGNTP